MEVESQEDVVSQELRGKQLSSNKLHRYDSLDIESCKVSGYHGRGSKDMKWSMILQLAFQSIGIVYGDIGTSPLYVFSGTFPKGISHVDDVPGALSLILYTLTLVLVVKYVFIVLYANDNGDGGTFALYSLICRYAKVGLIPSQQAEDANVSNYQLELPGSSKSKMASCLKSELENSRFSKLILFFATLLGTSMLIGDGVLTPCISVLSAVGGIKEATSAMTEDRIVWISVAILIVLFLLQRLGTDKVGYTFAPILVVWFILIAGIGIYNIIRFDPTVIRALNPWYIIDYFRRNKKSAWISLGGVILCTTGAEALFADVGHFSVLSIQISTCTVVFPSLILAYTGQASFLLKHPDLVANTFFKSVPEPIYWPMFVVTVLSAIIASQALISGAFSIIQQSLALGCFPRVKIVHTSAKYEGQVYVPEANYLLMLACIGVTLGFRTTEKIGNAFGIAVVFVMTLTSCFLVLVMIMIWKSNILFVIAYAIVIGSVELLYLSSVLSKFDQGGYLPLAFAAILMSIMYVWNYVYRRKYYYDREHQVSPGRIKQIADEINISRIPGLAMFYTELVEGIPPIFKHYVENVPALHSILIFVSIKSLPISKVPAEERFIFRRVEPKELNMYRCVARYGYMDVVNEEEPFERMLVQKLNEFIRSDLTERLHGKELTEDEEEQVVEGEIEAMEKACNAGIVHLISENEVVAAKGAGLGKRIVIDYAYNFLKKNLSQGDEKPYDIPQKRMVKVGMTYEL